MFGYNIIKGELYDLCTKEIVEASRKQPINSLEFRIKIQIFECIQRMKFSDTLLEKMLNKARSGKLIEIIYNDYMKKGYELIKVNYKKLKICVDFYNFLDDIE